MAKTTSSPEQSEESEGETLEDKLIKNVKRAELEEEYGDVIQAYKKIYDYGAG